MDCYPSDRHRIDQLDRLPDELLLLVLDRVRDARSLTRCLSVSKRFGDLVPQTRAVFLPIPRRSPPPPTPKPGRVFPLNLLAKAARIIRRAIVPKSGSDDYEQEYFYDPQVILKRFTEVRSLDIEIPSCGTEIGPKNGKGFLLQWAADFGAELNSCTILGANSLESKVGKQGSDDDASPEEKAAAEPMAEPILADKDLKLRVVWIISCLIAAASRHVLLKELIEENPKLEDVQIKDGGKQGRLRMGKEQVVEVRSSAAAAGGSGLKLLERSVVPDLKMKLWFVPEMELPETGFVMKGATLIVIRPAKEKNDCSVDDGEGLLNDWFGGGGGEDDGDERGKAFGEAVRKMRKMKMKRSFTMEMNSF